MIQALIQTSRFPCGRAHCLYSDKSSMNHRVKSCRGIISIGDGKLRMHSSTRDMSRDCPVLEVIVAQGQALITGSSGHDVGYRHKLNLININSNKLSH